MIYLLRILSSIEKSDGTEEVSFLTRLGYTEDRYLKARVNEFIKYCPSTRLICTIPGATYIHKKVLESKFKKYRYGNRIDWFYEDKDMVDEIKGLTLDDLDSMAKNNMP